VIRAGNDADLLILGDDLSIDATIARGRVFLKRGKPVARGMFDQTIMDQLA
jgi:hypothetical protein